MNELKTIDIIPI